MMRAMGPEKEENSDRMTFLQNKREDMIEALKEEVVKEEASEEAIMLKELEEAEEVLKLEEKEKTLEGQTICSLTEIFLLFE